MLAEQVPIPLTFRHADYDAAGVVAAGVDLDQTAADVGYFSIPFKCQVYLAGLEITETCAGTTPGVVKMDKRPTAGSDTDRGNGDIATFNMGTTAAGKFLYDVAGRGTVLNPGEQVVVEIATQPVTGPAGQFNPVLLVVPVPETMANMANAVETT
jgi:hypothetical protein